jgi:hypothetical protein
VRYLYCINLTSVWRNDCEWSIIFITELVYQEISINIDINIINIISINISIHIYHLRNMYRWITRRIDPSSNQYRYWSVYQYIYIIYAMYKWITI